MKKEIYFFIGTTAELIKVSPVLKELKKRNVNFKIITSGQNYIAFEELETLVGKYNVYYAFKHKVFHIPGFIYLNFLTWIVTSLFIYLPFFTKEFNNLNKNKTFMIVHGDTVTSLLGTIVAKLNGVKIIHIESGYRSFNFFEPFPEEFCRTIDDFFADVHFCPNSWCLNNLRADNSLKIDTYLNTGYEPCMQALKSKEKIGIDLPKKFFILILHRQEHMLFKKDLTKKYIDTVSTFAKSGLKCIFILHHVTENFLQNEGILDQIKKNPNIIILRRLPYITFQKVLGKSEFIATDGGSNQQEAFFLGKPCLILRRYTEQIEGLNSNVVLAKDDMSIVKKFLKNYKTKIYPKVKAEVLPSKIVVDYLEQL